MAAAEKPGGYRLRDFRPNVHTMLDPLLRLAVPPFALTAACLCGGLPAQEPAAAPRFENGEAQVVDAFDDRREWIVHDLFVETSFDSDGDGTLDRVHVSVTRPKQTETEGLRLPVIYETSPYFAGTAPMGNRGFFWKPEQELGAPPPKRGKAPSIRTRKTRPVISPSQTRTWVPRGYIVVHSSSPGTGLSQGCPTIGGANESLAPKAVIDWLCGRAKGFKEVTGDELAPPATWCNGKVGMTGTSYNGTLPIAAATTGVEGLEAIIPIAPNTSYYHYYRSNGLVRHPDKYMGEDIDVLYDFVHSGNPDRRAWCNQNVRDKILTASLDRKTGDYNEFWASRDYANQLDGVRCAVLMAHAFNDWNVMPEHSVRIYASLKQRGIPCMAFFHQGGHGGPPPLSMMNRWFTRYLHGVENGVENDPRSWIVREGDRRSAPTAYPEYPHPDAEAVALHPGKGGRKQGPLVPDATTRQGRESLIDNVEVAGPALAQAASSPHRLLYVTPELKAPLHVSGTARIAIRMAASKPAVNLSVWVVSLPWSEGRRSPIYENIITRGWADPQNADSLTESHPLKRGQMVSLEFDLQPDDQVIPKGQRIGLMVFASDREYTLWPKPGTKLTVDLDATQLLLPVVGGAAAFRAALGGE